MKYLIAVILLLVIAFPALAQTEFRAVNVGKGDALIIKTEGRAYLIDTGKANNIGRLRRAFEDEDITSLDGVFITHTDNDHIGGIDWLIGYSGVEVKKWYFSAYYTGMKPKKHPMNRYSLDGEWLKAGDRVVISESAYFDVLAPFEADDANEDDNSLVMMLNTPDGRILLCGDMESAEETQLLFSGADLDCDVLKVAHHGEDTATAQAFLNAAKPEYAVISTSAEEKPGTPSAAVMSLLAQAGCDTYVTQDAAAVRFTLDGGAVSGGYIYADAPTYGVDITVVDEDDEYIEITNTSGDLIDLDGWYVYSEEGKEYLILEGSLGAGETLSVGTRATSYRDYDVFWDDKNVISNKQHDPIMLYDRDGNRVD